MPTVEFTESMASDEQREMLRELVESSSGALEEDSDETADVGEGDEDSVDEQIDALERELLEQAGEQEDGDELGGEDSEADDTAEVETSDGEDETDDKEER
jgi:hypothetical protein